MTDENDDLSRYFIEDASSEDAKNEKIHFMRGEAKMPSDFAFEFDEETGVGDENESVNYEREEILILLAAWKSKYIEEYKNAFAKSGIRVIAVSNEEEFLSFSRIFPVNGVVSDLSTEDDDCSDEMRELLTELDRNYPLLRTKFNPETNSIEFSENNSNFKSLDEFIDNKYRKFKARTLRSDKRICMSLNVEISPEKEFIRVEKSVTLDVSGNGLFVIAVAPFWRDAEKCFICVKEFNSESLIECNVVRKIGWGEKPFKAPGLGVEIVSIHESLKDYYNTLLHK